MAALEHRFAHGRVEGRVDLMEVEERKRRDGGAMATRAARGDRHVPFRHSFVVPRIDGGKTWWITTVEE
jgi:hypothetical protein